MSTRPERSALFCVPGHVRRRHSSQANCPISREPSRRRGTQGRLSRLDPRSVTSRGRSKVGKAGPCQPAREGTGHFDVGRRLGSPFTAPQHPWPYSLQTQPPSKHPHPHLHQVVCYDFMIIYGALSGCACTFTTPSWSPLITGPRCRQSWRDGGAC